MLTLNDSQTKYLSYEGPFEIEVISTLAQFLRKNINASDFVRRKLYRVFIELVQNVALYSADKALLAKNKTNGKGQVYIIEEKEVFRCVTINKILKEHASVLTKNCTDINNSTHDELRAKKKKLRALIKVQDTGAHIGLIMIKTYSGCPLEFKIIEDKEKDELYFYISATIKNELHS
jgi:hypothetical protein